MLGFAGKSYEIESTVRLSPGQETVLGKYTLRYDALKLTDDGQKQMITAHVALFTNGKEIERLYPARWIYKKHENQPTTEVAIRRSLAEDFYMTLGGFELETQTAIVQLNVNPLVDWVWLGFGILAIGTGIALLPETVFSFATARLAVPGAATTAMLILLMLMPGVSVSAQAPAGTKENVAPIQINPLEEDLQGQIMCMCGGCRAPLNDCPMPNCHAKIPEKERLHAMVEEGRTRDEIIAAFVKEYGGQDVLGAPIDKGFNRLAWLFPYIVGVGSAVAVGFAAVRLSKRRDPQADEAAAPQDPELNERLDDELRDLD
jgi:cytochrome c-type biogenesis protein CcmF